MNEESAFLAHLREHPEDETARLVFADWLTEHGKHDEAVRQREMAPGYRALVARSFEGVHVDANGEEVLAEGEGTVWIAERDTCVNIHPAATLPGDWLGLMTGDVTAEEHRHAWRDYPTREALWAAAALAFAKLPPGRQAELLAQEVPA